MDPIEREDHNYTYVGEHEDPNTHEIHNKGVGDLSVRVEEGGYVFSHWKPSDEELALLNEGGVIEMHIIGHPIPPVGLEVVPAQAPASQNGDLDT